MATKTDTAVSVADDMKHERDSGISANMEAGTAIPKHGELKRDLSSRHINMIALAGMIVSPSSHRSVI
jgi:amino acid permease